MGALLIVYAVIAFLVAVTGLCVAKNPRIAEFYAVALFVTGTSVVTLVLFASDY